MIPGQVISFVVPLEATSIMSSVAIRIGAMLQDIHTQHYQSRPWLLLDDSQTFTSSAVTQKLSPGVVMSARAKASDVVASPQLMPLRAHNITPGMTDYKASFEPARPFVWGIEMLSQFNGVMKALRINARPSIEELNGDWTTSMKLAETLQRPHQVPFRAGHHFATVVLHHAKANKWLPHQFPYAQGVKRYAESAQKYGMPMGKLPLDEATFKATLSREIMVRTCVGIAARNPLRCGA